MKINLLFRLAYLCLCVLLTGCAAASAVVTASKIANLALEASGLKKPDLPELPELQKPPRNVLLKLHAGVNLNAGNTNKPLSMVVRIYKLKQTSAFYSAPYESFLSPEKEKAVLGADLVEVREINLVPSQLYEVVEKVSREAAYVGVVVLFLAPAPQRWRAAFAVKEAETSGIILGLHACSITLGKGALPEQTGTAVLPVTPARCQ